MIQKLHLKNCQSHKDSILEFNPGVNTLVGDTDSGKSAILRSLEKVIWNSFTSKELISHWGGPLRIELTVDDNVITFINDKKDSYTLNKIEFNAINGKVPEEIVTVLNMDSINMQSQIDSFFLLNETSGFVASYLNKIANLSSIDTTTKSLKSELNETKRTIEHDKLLLENKEKEIKLYDYLPDLNLRIQEIDELESNYTNTLLEITGIKYLILQNKEIKRKREENKKIIQLAPIVNSTLKLIDEEKAVSFESSMVKVIISRIESIDLKISKVNELVSLQSLVTDTIESKSKLTKLQAKLDSLNLSITKISTIEETLKLANSNLIKERKKYNNEFAKLDICFFCGSKLKK